ncbi:hypothetical protein BDZ94DRAFT_1273615 [Collybia nuda]|uniref:F-box domain-containing protein n=1 Tax=Collybia nuda TaxID=64659 RepID=A0A9P5XX28_9AGAR|nr:hypothetical protein BDZ94DRAFT_1273615 [Collybia nuda]
MTLFRIADISGGSAYIFREFVLDRIGYFELRGPQSYSMNPVILIPEDIIETILKELHDDHDTLKKASVVSRSFLPLSQKHLFSIVELDLSRVDTALQRLQNLSDVLISRPKISLYVREFKLLDYAELAWELDAISISKQQTISEDILPTLFKALRQVRSLSFSFLSPNRRDVQNWMRNSSSLSSAIIDLCLSPNVTNITIRNVGNFPLHILSRCRNLRRLTLGNLQYARQQVNGSITPDAETTTEDIKKAPGSLEIIEVDSSFHVTLPRISLAQKEPNSALYLSRLRALRVTGPFVSWKLNLGLQTIGEIAQTLECFMWCEANDWGGNHTMSSQFDSGALDLTPMVNLRFMIFTFIFDIQALNWFVKSLEKISGSNLLEEIFIILFPDAWEENAVRDQLPVWASRLDSILRCSGFPHLKKVSILVGWFLDEIPKRMPLLHPKPSEKLFVKPLYTDLEYLWNEVLIKAGILV